MNRLLPHPGLTALLVIIWMLALNAFSFGGFVVALVLGIAVPLFTAPFWPDRPKMRFGLPLAKYVLLVTWDIVIANFQIAWIILFRKSRDLRPAWLVIPLDLTSTEAITMLAGTISLTPGTVSSDISTDGEYLLVHALDTADPEGEIARIKQRYERRLMEIFP
ncbi:MAG: Na+/H+ antiporter subunit E [Erythrobacter sp. SCN 62-14]|nr:MAG: Na+/H+ antiporter subunit E [Erythrobacter sp. SCN 62-14]